MSERDHQPFKHHPFRRRASDDRIDPNANEIEAKHHNPEGQILASGEPSPDDDLERSEAEPEMLFPPETRPISHEQLVIEVKGIYAGLVMVEVKCIDIDKRQSVAAQEKDPAKRVALNDDQWQSLIALHKRLLHERYDFFWHLSIQL